MKKTYTLTVYTENNILEFDVVSDLPNFSGAMTDALESGAVSVDTVDGNVLALSMINVVAVEIKFKNTPPIS